MITRLLTLKPSTGITFNGGKLSILVLTPPKYDIPLHVVKITEVLFLIYHSVIKLLPLLYETHKRIQYVAITAKGCTLYCAANKFNSVKKSFLISAIPFLKLHSIIEVFLRCGATFLAPTAS